MKEEKKKEVWWKKFIMKEAMQAYNESLYKKSP